jgi:hypothetical protein
VEVFGDTNLSIIDASSKSTLSMLNLQSLHTHGPHSIWLLLNSNSRDVIGASIKCKMLTATYTLQSNKAKFNSSSVSSTCPFCQIDDEDVPHFLVSCPAFEYTLTLFMPGMSLATTPGLRI